MQSSILAHTPGPSVTSPGDVCLDFAIRPGLESWVRFCRGCGSLDDACGLSALRVPPLNGEAAHPSVRRWRWASGHSPPCRDTGCLPASSGRTSSWMEKLPCFTGLPAARPRPSPRETLLLLLCTFLLPSGLFPLTCEIRVGRASGRAPCSQRLLPHPSGVHLWRAAGNEGRPGPPTHRCPEPAVPTPATENTQVLLHIGP